MLQIEKDGVLFLLDGIKRGINPIQGSATFSSSKVNTIKELSAVEIEKMESIAQFIDTVVTENRLEQGFSKLREMGLEIDVKNTGKYIQWVVSDSLTEERDVIIKSGFEVKEISPKISEKAKRYWFANMVNHE